MAIYGNFINRTLVLTGKYFDGKVPALGTLEDIDKDVLAQIADSKAKIEQMLNKPLEVTDGTDSDQGCLARVSMWNASWYSSGSGRTARSG